MNGKAEVYQAVLFVLVSMVLAISSGMAENPEGFTMPSALELRKTGVVRVLKDADGNVAGIKLIVTSYDIVLDEASKPLETMDGQKAKVICTFKQEGGKKWLTVKSVEPIPGEEEQAPVKKPAEAETPKKAPEKATEETPTEETPEKPAEKPEK